MVKKLSTTNFTMTILILFLLAWLFAIFLAWQVVKKDVQKKYRKLSHKSQPRKHHYHSKAQKVAISNHGYSGLWHQLLIRCNFDISLAERLVANCQKQHPNKDDRWCIEKCLWDIERDRM